MDITKLAHPKNSMNSIVVAVVLSLLIVVLAAVIGRGALNLKGEIVSEYVTDAVVMHLFTEHHPDEIIQEVIELPRGIGPTDSVMVHLRR